MNFVYMNSENFLINLTAQLRAIKRREFATQ